MEERPREGVRLSTVEGEELDCSRVHAPQRHTTIKQREGRRYRLLIKSGTTVYDNRYLVVRSLVVWV
jgi:hypothetical protein